METKDPSYRLLREEIFGPVVTAYVYPDAGWDDMLRIIDTTSPYALTGSVFATERAGVRHAAGALRNAAGNFYVNDSPPRPWSASSRSAAPADRVPTTRPGRR